MSSGVLLRCPRRLGCGPLEGIFASVEYAGRFEHPWSMPYQHFDIWVCRRMKMPFSDLWPRTKSFH